MLSTPGSVPTGPTWFCPSSPVAISPSAYAVGETLVASLEGGVVFNVGSAVILPEAFLKALSVARNLGHPVDRFTSVNLDFMRQYRPETNVVDRPTRGGGRGISLVGQHEILVPLLSAGVIEAHAARNRSSRRTGTKRAKTRRQETR